MKSIRIRKRHDSLLAFGTLNSKFSFVGGENA